MYDVFIPIFTIALFVIITILFIHILQDSDE